MTKKQLIHALSMCSDDTQLGLLLPTPQGVEEGKRPFLHFNTLEVIQNENGECLAGFIPGGVIAIELGHGANLDMAIPMPGNGSVN